jgi:hypothetical protein
MAMNRIFDQCDKPGELLHAVLEGLVIAEISDATLPRAHLEPANQPRRGLGIQSLRPGRVSGPDKSGTTR